jgi:hypothetical protein
VAIKGCILSNILNELFIKAKIRIFEPSDLGYKNMKQTFAYNVIEFYDTLTLDAALPKGVSVMNPFQQQKVRTISGDFFRKFYNDKNARTFILGINPGRFGAGVTGITFTDPIRLEKACGILNDLEKRAELSSLFIYDMINRFGGAEKFYSKFYLSAVCPLGFVKNGKNMNFYDDRILKDSVKDFIVSALEAQIKFGANKGICFCLGEGENYKYLQKLNEEYSFFNEIIPLAHPRFIMQYRLKKKEDYINHYLAMLQKG